MSNPTDLPVLIVGGGIGGLAVALGLAKHGIRCEVLEQAPELGEIGAGIQLAPNALRVIDELGLLDRVLAHAVFPPRAAMLDARSSRVLGWLAFDETFVSRYGYPYVVTHRADLHEGLLSACLDSELVTLRTDFQVSQIAQNEGGVDVRATRGEHAQGSALIGADGLHSVVRSNLIGDDIVFHDDVAYRGTIDYAVAPERDGKDDISWWVGSGLHLMQYPVRSKQLYNQVAVFTRRDAGEADVETWGSSVELKATFDPACDLVRTAVSQVDHDRHWQMADRDPQPGWTHGLMTLLGDAAHPMLQNLAQGGCQALEDAAVLAHCMADCEGDWAKAFVEYEQLRYPRTSQVQTWARHMRNIAHADDTLAAVRDAILQGEAIPLTYTDWLYGWSVPT